MPNSHGFRQLVLAYLQDDGSELTAQEYDRCIAAAVREYTRSRFYKSSTLVNGTGGDISITSGVVYDALIALGDPARVVTKIQYPLQTTAGEFNYLFEGKDFVWEEEGDTVPTAIRFLTTIPPTGTNNVRIHFQDFHRYKHPPTGIDIETAGTEGSTTWAYQVTAVDATGETLPCLDETGAIAEIKVGNATLNGTNYNTIIWDEVYGATSYKVYRTTAGGTPSTTGLIATVTAPTHTYNDQGAAGDSSVVPVADTTTMTIPDYDVDPVAHLAVSNCLCAIANKKAGNIDDDFSGSDTDFPGQMERYMTRCEAERSLYERLVTPAAAATEGGVEAAFAQKVFLPPGSGDSDYLIDDYNETDLMR